MNFIKYKNKKLANENQLVNKNKLSFSGIMFFFYGLMIISSKLIIMRP